MMLPLCIKSVHSKVRRAAGLAGGGRARTNAFVAMSMAAVRRAHVGWHSECRLAALQFRHLELLPTISS